MKNADTFNHLKETVLPFIKSNKRGNEIGKFRYSAAVEQPALYSSTYAVMTYSLLGTLDNESE